METKIKARLAAGLFIIFTSCMVGEIQCRKQQGEALGNLYKAKLKGFVRTSSLEHYYYSSADHIHTAGDRDDHGDHRGLMMRSKKEEDRIVRLPGQPKVEFSQFGGYVTVDQSAGRALFYYFAEAPHHRKHSLPLLLWLNGGPGCSSLGYGAMQELGPFRVRSDGKTLYRNKYSWNNAANVLFLESPAGVGYSYSNTTSDYDKMGDSKTAADNYVFLVKWLERFPEYRGREFYIAGESYAGHYVPQLAHTIFNHNKNSNNTFINLKGILIGNAVVNDETDLRGMYDFFGSHALISDETLTEIQKNCNFSPDATTQSRACDAATEEADVNTYYIDIYNIYAPSCTESNLTVYPKKIDLMEFDECSNDYVYAYLNREDVQRAFHANVTKLSHDWEACSEVIGYWDDSPSTIIPLLKEFMENDLRVWIFSGDMDGRIPVTSTKYSIKKMKLAIKTPWHAWYHGGEVGGYTQVYKFKGELTFATVRGAGHQVPSYQPKRALSLIMHFLSGSSLPDTTRYD